MRTIYKYILDLDDSVNVSMPEGSIILDAQAQHGQVSMWAMIDTDKMLYDRKFRVIGTGHPIPELSEHLHFISTVQIEELNLVFHIFEATL